MLHPLSIPLGLVYCQYTCSRYFKRPVTIAKLQFSHLLEISAHSYTPLEGKEGKTL